MRNNTAVVLGLCPNGLGVVRSLGRNGIPVLGFDYKKGEAGFYSRYVKASLCPNPYLEPEALCSLMMEIGARLDSKGVLIPTSDEFVLFISRFRASLKRYFYYALPSKDVVEALLNKRWQYDMAKRHGIPYPKTFYPEQKRDIQAVLASADYPVIVKPCHTHLWKEAGFTVKAYRADTSTELETILNMVLDRHVEVIVQELIPGPVTNFYEACSYLDSTYQPRTVFIKRKLRQFPLEMGLGSYMESVRNDTVEEMTKKLLTGIRYHGLGEVEFKKDDRDGRFKMIEINARVTLQNSLSECCGINFPLFMYNDSIGRTTNLKAPYREGVRWLWAEIDFEAFKQAREKKEITLAEWLRTWAACNVEAVMSFRDIRPLIETVKFGLVQNSLK